MDASLAARLCAINNEFYRRNAASFSATRHTSWPGWQQCLRAAGWVSAQSDVEQSADPAAMSHASVLDIGCGNLRFEALLQREFPRTQFDFYAFDNCAELVRSAEAVQNVHYAPLDVCAQLQQGAVLDSCLDVPPCNLSVAFGFMHHVPTAAWREQVLRAMLDNTCAGGFAAVSLWRFMDDAGLAEKAVATTRQAQRILDIPKPDEGDYLLGWNNEPNTWRYCHSFSDADVDMLVKALNPVARVAARFRADGRSGTLNEYVVLRRL